MFVSVFVMSQEEDLTISPIKIVEADLTSRMKRNASAAGPSNASNVQYNRAYGIGSGNSHRAPIASHMVQLFALFYFKLHLAKKYKI